MQFCCVYYIDAHFISVSIVCVRIVSFMDSKQKPFLLNDAYYFLMYMQSSINGNRFDVQLGPKQVVLYRKSYFFVLLLVEGRMLKSIVKSKSYFCFYCKPHIKIEMSYEVM